MFMEIKSIFLIRLLCDRVKILPVVPNHSSYLEKEVTDHSVGNRVSWVMDVGFSKVGLLELLVSVSREGI